MSSKDCHGDRPAYGTDTFQHWNDSALSQQQLTVVSESPNICFCFFVPSQVSSQTSSVSSSDEYIIVLPDCFDTSRPLGESMYSSAMSQPDAIAAGDSTGPDPEEEEEREKEETCDFEPCREAPLTDRKEETVAVEESLADTWPPHVSPIHSSVNQMLCASQTLDAVTLTPEVVSLPVVPQPLHPPPTLYSPRCDGDEPQSSFSLSVDAAFNDFNSLFQI